jgi:phospholipid/cholesterol/gamma-HCH transport system ATP-binding protein
VLDEQAIGRDSAQATVRRALASALARGSEVTERMASADTTVSFEVGGERSATLLLDRIPVELADRDEPGEVVIKLGREQAAAYASGALPITDAVLTRQVATSGPIRKYLEIDPILRSLLAQASGRTAAAHQHTTMPATMGSDVDPDLLAIETRGLCKSFGRTTVLRDLDLKIPAGAISVILGPSGTGKSVCLNHVLGLMTPDAGEVLIRGRALSTMKAADLRALRRDIGVMYQDGALFSTMNVYDNVAFPLRQHTDFGEPEVRELVSDQLQRVGLARAGTLMPNQLSGGMRKRAGLARALVMNPGIVLCDEPDSGLDPVRTALLADLLAERHADQGGTMLIVTHNVMLAKTIADHMSVLWQGRVVAAGLASDVIGSEDPFVSQFIDGGSHGPLGMD